MTGDGPGACVVLDRFNRGTDRAARFVSENHDERRAQDLHCILEAGDPVVGSEVARYAYDEKITAAGVKRVLWRDARIGATQDSGKRVLSHRQGFALGFEVVPSCNPFHVALVACHQALERYVGRDDVLRFRRPLGLLRERPAGDGEADCRTSRELQKTPSRNDRFIDVSCVTA